ncbi:histidine-containing phosphotransfer protein 1-like isoform X1 [Mangifera indica]|uniref:histidine-containing phosphotransfer protein 1-like isoform X1 n=1 Tax=Mangifera indica TaxID=29780 RepID=UPI001CFB8814|nr:histidine-containing phosphotransfer protein 1-like isoform X1 [Mangifera indica]
MPAFSLFHYIQFQLQQSYSVNLLSKRSVKMAFPSKEAQIKTFLKSMFDEGLLDCQFTQIQALQDANNPDFVNEVVTLFCTDTERIITEMNKFMSQNNIDFSKLNSYAVRLTGSSSSIGAARMKAACVDLRRASDDESKERCLQALDAMTREYCLFRNKFHTLMQLDKGFIGMDANQQ